MIRDFWKDEARLERVRKMYVEGGMSCSEIAASVGHGVSRNAIIGIAHRKGWTKAGRQAPSAPTKALSVPGSRPAAAPAVPRSRHVGKVGDRFAPKPASQSPFGETDPVKAAEKRIAQQMAGFAAIQQAVELAGAAAIPLIQRRTFQCAWPVGTPDRPADQMCCGQPVPANAIRAAPAYCAAHGAKAISKHQPGVKARANLQRLAA